MQTDIDNIYDVDIEMGQLAGMRCEAISQEFAGSHANTQTKSDEHQLHFELQFASLTAALQLLILSNRVGVVPDTLGYIEVRCCFYFFGDAAEIWPKTRGDSKGIKLSMSIGTSCLHLLPYAVKWHTVSKVCKFG